MKGGSDPFFFSGQPLFPPFIISLSLLASPRASNAFSYIVYSPVQPLDTSGHVSARRKAADASQRRALEHEAERATVDAMSPDHLEPPPCAS